MKVAAFNAKRLGLTKVKKPIVSKYLTKIISQYSVMVILEVVNKSKKVMELLQKKLNSTAVHQYEMICSSPIGRNTYKEKFVCFYRKDEVKLTAHHQYEDNQPGDEDAFAREPLLLRFNCPTTVVEDLVLIPVHTQPENSKKELDELYDVVGAIKREWKTKNIMILGDFNAAGGYLSKKKKKQLRISSKHFFWLIDDDVDTTTSNSNRHSYDRIVVYGKEMLKGIIHKSAKSFNFEKKFRLTDKTALSISDHYPVEVKLKTVPATKGTQKRSKTVQTETPAGKRRQKQESPSPQRSDTETSDSEDASSESSGSDWE